MEEKQERRNVGEIELEGGQPSRNSGQTGRQPEEHRIDIDKIWTKSLKKARESTQSKSQWPRIPKVPQMLRGTQDFEKFYEPRVISFGPYHYDKPGLHPGEMIKPLYAEQFLADSKQDIKDLYTKIVSNIKAVRNCYDWNGTKEYDDEKLAWMMLLDGCMTNILRDHQICFVEQDLFLLENQLPFGVLKLIFEEATFEDGSIMQEMIKNFVTPDTRRPDGSTSKPKLEEKDEEPSHLLDLLRSALLGRYKKSSKQEVGSHPEQEQEAEKKGKLSSSSGGGNGGSQPEQEQEAEKKVESSSSSPRGDGGFCCPCKNGKQGGIWQSFRHIKELKAAGVYLKPSRTSFLTDISFKSYFFYGYLKLPPITLDDSTKPKFWNMVAYEMCPDAPDDYAVTSYVCFLKDLIDHADDVKELRSKHILHNFLGSDEDVAQIFNEIGNGLVDPEIYGDVKARIQKHYDKRVNTWIAEALHGYFRSPWTFMALIAAVLILTLTGLQTYYAHPGLRNGRLYD
ncbi:hypothetical protein AAG906_006461 [Vitis piasezkii]